MQRTNSYNNLQENTTKKENITGKLVGLLVKIKNSEEIRKYCCERLSKDFMQKLLSENVSEGFLQKVECVIDEFNKLFKHTEKAFPDLKIDGNVMIPLISRRKEIQVLSQTLRKEDALTVHLTLSLQAGNLRIIRNPIAA